MKDREAVVFVEVRYRKSERWGGALASVTREKRRRLIRTAGVYLRRHPHLARLPCRFDVVAVAGSQDDPVIRWIRDAFDG
jgi:putative endonuclease